MYDLCSGTNRKMRLTGRPQEVAGVLATSKLYALSDQILAFFPQVPHPPAEYLLFRQIHLAFYHDS